MVALRRRGLGPLRARLTGPGAERGSAVVETVFLAVVLLVPIVYLIVAISRIQAGSYAAAASAREAARAFVVAPDSGSGAARAQVASQVALSGFDVEGTPVALSCSADPCLTPEGTVTARSEVHVRLPLVPDFLAGALPTEVTVSVSHTQQVDRYREARP